MEKKKFKATIAFTILWILIVLIVFSSATFAWFTLTNATNIYDMNGSIDGEGINFLISNREAGPFEASCDLVLSSDCKELSPVTTSNLNTFYTQGNQDANGIVTKFNEVNDVDKRILRGTVYLKTEDASCDCYLDMSKLDFGSDVQVLASLRFGIKVKGNTFIFKLDDMADLSSAKSRQTTTDKAVIYNGSSLEKDPAENISAHSVKDGKILANATPLCRIEDGEVVRVDYFLYLEGCDENCYNPVQAKDLSLKLGFWGAQ